MNIYILLEYNRSFFQTGLLPEAGIIAFSNRKTALPNFSSPAFLIGLRPEVGIIAAFLIGLRPTHF